MMACKHTLLGLTALFLCHTANAHDAHHTHGKAEVYVTYADKQLQWVLTSPAMDIAGFEGKPETAEQKATIKNLKTELSDTQKLLRLTDQDCQPHSQKVTLTADHHSEISVTYQFICQDNEPPTITLTLFERFASLHHIEGFAIINGEQSYRELTPAKPNWPLSKKP